MHQVSFAPDGKQVLVIDRDGNRHEALILPGQSTELVKMLTTKGITFAVQSNAPQSEVSGLLSVLPSILLPVAIIGGLFFLQRRNQEGGGGGMGGMGGPGGPMGMGKSKSKIQMEVPPALCPSNTAATLVSSPRIASPRLLSDSPSHPRVLAARDGRHLR